MPRDDGPFRPPACARALSNKNIENSARVTPQRSRPPKLPSEISEIPDTIGERDRLIERYIDRRRERRGRGEEIESSAREAEWSGYLFGLAPNLPFSLFTVLQPKHAIFAAYTQNSIREYRFYCSLYEFIVFIISCFACSDGLNRFGAPKA